VPETSTRRPAHEWLAGLSPEAAAGALARCCASQRWVAGMLERAPFASMGALQATAAAVWSELGREDYLEAFAGHPEIGENLGLLREKFAATAGFSAGEQAGIEGADEATLLELREANRAYRQRFGFIFLICASGKSAKEMLAAMRGRLENDADIELAIAASEQAKITALRLEKLGS
jgi:2-oxo-4-hydroxy-4-carboxy-5-ureidoimidazoline decarboxylase